MTSHEEMLDNVAVYALGVLSPGEAAIVVEHMRTCEQCEEEYRRLRSSVTAIAYSSEACADAATGATVASPLIKARLMQRIRHESTPRSTQEWWAYAAVAACLALALLTGLVDVALTAHLRDDRSRIAQENVTIADLAAPSSRRYAFGNGEVVANGRRLYLAMQRLPAPPAGRVYQAWTLVRGATRVAPSVTFRPGGDGVAVVALPENAASVVAVAVSVEPEGGSKQPTTNPIALVKLTRRT